MIFHLQIQCAADLELQNQIQIMLNAQILILIHLKVLFSRLKSLQIKRFDVQNDFEISQKGVINLVWDLEIH